MSKIGSKGIKIKEDWLIKINKREIIFTIKNNIHKISFPKPFFIKKKNGLIFIKIKNIKPKIFNRIHNKNWGTYRSLIRNFFIGKTCGFTKNIEIFGVGYSVFKTKNFLVFSLGFSHKIEISIPFGIDISIKDEKNLTIFSEDNKILGDFCYKIKNLVRRNPYKKKGIFELGEVFNVKQKKKK